MLRSRQRRAWWVAGAIGILVAALGILLFVPGVRPTPKVLQITVVEPVRSEPAPPWTPPPPPPAAPPQPVPPPPAVDDAPAGLDHASRLDRADWIGGGIVVCDVRGVAPSARGASVEPEKGMSLDGSVDLVSRIATVQDGHLWLTVREPSGEVPVMLFNVEDGPADMSGVRARIRWSGAEAGQTVGCSALWQPPSAHVNLTVTDRGGASLLGGPDRGMIMVRGCGLMLPLFASPQRLPIEAGTCTLRIERRNATFPLPVAYSDWTAVRLLPGETLDLTLTAPDEPPMYKPPELHELRALADLAAWGGSVALAEVVQNLIDELVRGRWSPDTLADLQEALMEPSDGEIDERPLVEPGDAVPDPLDYEALDTAIE